VSEGSADSVVETPPVRGAAVAFIFVTILLDTLALGLIIPVLPKLIESFVDNDTASAARMFGVFGTAWAVMQFFFSPILGGAGIRNLQVGADGSDVQCKFAVDDQSLRTLLALLPRFLPTPSP